MPPSVPLSERQAHRWVEVVLLSMSGYVTLKDEQLSTSRIVKMQLLLMFNQFQSLDKIIVILVIKHMEIQQ